MQCFLCLYNKYDEPHRCVGTVTVNNVEGKYAAQLRDGLGDVKRQCPHLHDNISEAVDCGKTHYVKHQKGECFCTYFKKPIPAHIYRTSKAQLYIIKHEGFFVWKIGVSGHSDGERLEQHLQNGWKIYAQWNNVDGVEAFTIEQETIQTWREAGFNAPLKPSDMPQGGASETVSYYNVNNDDIETLISSISKRLKFKPTR